MEKIIPYIPLLVPIIVIQLGLMAWALLDLYRQPATRGPKWVWVLVIVLVNLIGPLVYFAAGREE